MRPPRLYTTKARILYRWRRKMTRGQCFTINKVGLLRQGWKLSHHEVTSLPPELVTVVETLEISHVAAASRHRPMAGSLVAGEPGIPSALRAGYALWSNDAGTLQKKYLSATCLWPRLPESLLICGELSIAQLPSHKTKGLSSVAGCHEKSCRVMMSPNRDTTLVGNHDYRRGRNRTRRNRVAAVDLAHRGEVGGGFESFGDTASRRDPPMVVDGFFAGECYNPSTPWWGITHRERTELWCLRRNIRRRYAHGRSIRNSRPRARNGVALCKAGRAIAGPSVPQELKRLVHQGDRYTTGSLRWAFMKGGVV